jgi:hypothetical protein
MILQTDRADVNNQIAESQITNLPFTGNSGRNFQALYKLIPGFAPPAELHSDAGNPQRALGVNVNGASRSNNNTRLDGATVSYPWLPHIVAYVPPADAVETVNIVSNSFDAEQGMAGGSAINVSIKSGTNDFHGSAHWFHTNSAVRARNFFFVGSGLPKNIPTRRAVPSAVQSRRTSCFSSPTGSEPSDASSFRRSAPSHSPLCGAATSVEPARRSTIRLQEIPTAPGGRSSQTRGFHRAASIRPLPR